jgi:hypothetical protein
VVMTPNAAALGRRVFGRAWLHWDPPRHAFIFTRTSLGEVAQRAGLRVERMHTTARAARWSWREGRRLQRAGPAGPVARGRARGAGAIAFQFIEHTLLRFGDFGEELVLAAAADGGVRN